MNKIKFITSAKFITGCFVIIGLLLIGLSCGIKFNGENLSDIKILWNQFINPFFNTIGMTLLSAGFVSVVVELSTIQNVIDKAIANIMNAEFPINHFSDEKLNYINKRVAAARCKTDLEFIQNSIYELEPYMIESIRGLYYNYHNMKQIINPDEANGCFIKEMKYTYEVINRFELENRVRHTFKLYNLKPNMTKDELMQEFKVSEFKINSTDLIDEAEKYFTFEELGKNSGEGYDYLVVFCRKLQACKKHKVVIQFEYKTPIYDTTSAFKLLLPSKSIEHKIFIKNERNAATEWKIHGNAYTSFFCGNNNENGFSVSNDLDTNMTIKFEKWCIPGAGYVISYIK